MEEEKNLVRVEDETGKSYDMLILKEFDYKKKKYAVLMEMSDEESCECGDNCECGDDCKCGDNCECGDDCKCGDNCECGDDCKCSDNCECGDDCKCEHEPILCILEITKDENGEEIFKSVDDEKLFDKLIEEADKVLYE